MKPETLEKANEYKTCIGQCDAIIELLDGDSPVVMINADELGLKPIPIPGHLPKGIKTPILEYVQCLKNGYEKSLFDL